MAVIRRLVSGGWLLFGVAGRGLGFVDAGCKQWQGVGIGW